MRKRHTIIGANLVHGPVRDGKARFQALSIIEGGNHVVNNLWYRYRDQTADWMAQQLAA